MFMVYYTAKLSERLMGMINLFVKQHFANNEHDRWIVLKIKPKTVLSVKSGML